MCPSNSRTSTISYKVFQRSIGPTDLTANTVEGENTVPTVIDNLFSQGTICAPIIGVSFEPSEFSAEIQRVQSLNAFAIANVVDDPNGELTFGGTWVHQLS